MKKLPQFGGQDIDLYLLYKTVTNFGGWLKVFTFSFFVFHFHLHSLINPDIWYNLGDRWQKMARGGKKFQFTAKLPELGICFTATLRPVSVLL